MLSHISVSLRLVLISVYIASELQTQLSYVGAKLLARNSIYAIARYMSSSVRLSIRLSVPLFVTRVDQSKTFEVRITQLSPQSSPMTLVS